MVARPSIEVIVFYFQADGELNLHDAFQRFLQEKGYWNKDSLLAAPLKPDPALRFSDLDALLKQASTVRAFPLKDGETRDWYCNNEFMGGNTAVVIYKADMLGKTGTGLHEHNIKGRPLEAVKAVIMPGTAYAP